MSVSHPVATIIGTMIVMDELKEKLAGTKLASYDWRPMEYVDGIERDITELVMEAFERCETKTEAIIVVTVASVLMSRQQTMAKAEARSETSPPIETSKK